MPPTHYVTAPDDKGPLIVLVTLLCVVASACFVCAKILTKYAKYRALHSHDYCCFSALILNIVCAAATYVQVQSGLGKRDAALAPEQIEAFQKSEYALHIIFVVSLTLSKLTVLNFLATLALERPKARLVRILKALTVLFGFTSFMVSIFQCTPPYTWGSHGNRCINKSAFWDVYAGVDSAVNIAIATLPIHLIRKVQISWQKKLGVVAAFSGSLGVVPPVILRSIFIQNAQLGANMTWSHSNGVLMTQVAVNVGLMASCVAFVKPFLDSVVTGMLSADLRDRPTTDATLTSHRTRLLYVIDLLRPNPRPLTREADSERMRLRGAIWSSPERNGAIIHHASANGGPPDIQAYRDNDAHIDAPERVHLGSIRKTVEVQVFPS